MRLHAVLMRRRDVAGYRDRTSRPGVLESLEQADLILLAPSNPVVSIGPILAAGLAHATVAACAGPGRRIRWHPRWCSGAGNGSPAATRHRCEVDAAAVGLHYGARSRGGVLDAWAMDSADSSSADRVQQAGLQAVVTDLLMRPGKHGCLRQLRDQVGHVMIAGWSR